MNSSMMETWQWDLATATYPLRSMFYAVTPSETTFDKLEDVPQFVVAAVPYFFTFLALEIIIGTMKGWNTFLVGDLLTSSGAGLMSRLPEYVQKASPFL